MLSEKQAIDILQNQIADYVIGNYCAKCGDFSICENKDEDCYYIQAIDTVLNLITKLQKENENLKREKEENKFIIAMANNEMLGYNQGYADGKNQNINATELIVKNRNFYIQEEKINLYKRKIEFLQKENKEIEQYLNKRILDVEKCYNEMLTDIGGIKIINITGLSKKEKEEVINKRNCLLVQKHCYQEILEKLAKEKDI